MPWLALLFLALLLVVLPLPSAADGLNGYGLVVPVRPQLQGFNSLFQSPPLNAPATAPAPRQTATGLTATVQPGAICRPALIAAEARYGIPTGLLQAIGVVESGQRDERTGQREPWPWAVNAEGEPHFFDTKQQAVVWVRQAQARGLRSIDVGCAQINLLYHPNAFGSLEEAFEPVANADYAARFLLELWNTSAQRNWLTAAGHYHSRTPELADAYRQQVQAVFAGGARAPVLQASTASPQSSGPSSPFGAVRSEPGRGSCRLLPAPWDAGCKPTAPRPSKWR